MKLLVVEDDAALRRSLEATLNGAGHAPTCVGSGEAGLALAEEGFDALILDIGLPDRDGFDVLRQLRQDGSSLPVILLTARDRISDRIAGLDMGADDYVLKPFDPDELVARIRAVVRRRPSADAVVHYGQLRCDWARGSVEVAGRPLDLRPRELAALRILIDRAGRVVDRDMLVAEIFPNDQVSSNVLDVHIGRLRRKLQPDGPRLKTLRGVGYRLEA